MNGILRQTVMGGLLLSVIAFMIPVQEASAVPSFAREHKLSCTACHTGFPRLNEFGMEFKQRGFRLPRQDGTVLWEQDTLPISGVVLARYRNSFRDDPVTGDRLRKKNKFELEEIELMIAGTLAPKIGYFIEFEQEVADGEEFSVDQAWVQYSDILPESMLNVRGGKMLNEFFYLSQKRRLTLQRYLSPITFNVTGAELNGTWNGLRYAAGVANDERTESEVHDATVNLNNQLNGFYGWASYTLMDQTFGVRYINTKANSDLPAPVIDGRSRQQLDLTANFRAGPGEMILGYFHNFGLGGVNGQDRRNYLIEGILEAIPEKLFLDARFELQDTEFVMGGNNPTTANGTLVTLNTSYYLFQNVRLFAEFHKQSGEGMDVFEFAGPNKSATFSEERYLVGLHVGF